jgi:hypothetical protein
MKKNVGSIDRVIRIVAALVLAALYFMNVISGTLGIVLVVLAVIFAATSAVSFCPLYAMFGLSTCAVKGNS